MKKAKWLLPVMAGAFSLTLPLSGCGNKGETMSKSEQDKFRAPLGQPMPAEAKAEMEKMSKNAGAAQSQGAAKP